MNRHKSQSFVINNTPVATYSVVYDPNGGTGGHVDTGVAAGSLYTVLSAVTANVSYSGYNFVGWNTQPDGSGATYVPEDVITITGNLTLYAQWTPVITYTVIYDPNGGTGGYVDTGLPEGSLYTVLSGAAANVSNPGYNFAFWNTQADGSGTIYLPGDIITITGNLTLYAQWMPAATYAVAYDPNGGVGGHVETGLTPGSLHTVLSAEAANASNPGYDFVSWNTSPDGSGTTYLPGDVITINGDVALYAQWTPMQTDFTLERATSVLPAYQAAPNTWPLHGTVLPNLYMVDRILITLSPTPPVVVKWAYGAQDASYFATNGFDVTSTYTEGIPVSANGDYTVYAELSNGFTGVVIITIASLRDGTALMPYLLIDFGVAAALEPEMPGIGQYTLDFMQGGGFKLTANYELYEDIEMAGRAWTPIGTYDAEGFTGTLDGNGNAINNLTMLDSASDYLGLFGMVTSGASIANLDVLNCQIQSGGTSAAIAASCQSQSGEVSFVNCAVTGSIIGTQQAAGILGYTINNTGTILIQGCSANVSIEGYDQVGGIAGYMDAQGVGAGVTITDCHSEGSVYASFGSGGILGYIESTDNSSSRITNCYSLAAVTAEISASGGIAAYIVAVTSSILIQSCFSSGLIAGFSGVSGILARASSYAFGTITLTDCYSTGDRVSTVGSAIYTNYMGGVATVLYRDTTSNVLLQNCYTTGDITAQMVSLSSVLGGIVGAATSASASGSTVVQNCVALENVVSGNTANTARILGERIGGFVTLSNNFAYEGMLILINGVAKSPLDTGGAGLDGINASAAQLTTEATYDVTLGWDFVNLWSFGNGTYTLPILRSIPSGVQPTALPDYL